MESENLGGKGEKARERKHLGEEGKDGTEREDDAWGTCGRRV